MKSNTQQLDDNLTVKTTTCKCGHYHCVESCPLDQVNLCARMGCLCVNPTGRVTA